MADNKDKSNSSSFEDLSNIPAAELKESASAIPAENVPEQSTNETNDDDAKDAETEGIIDVIGNGQLVKKVRQ